MRNSRCDRGATLVEFAITSIFFFIVTFAIIEGARAIYHYNIVASIARDGARWAAVRGASSGRVASVNDVRTYVQSRSLGLAPTVNVTWTPSNQPGGTIEVAVTHTFTTIVPLATFGNLNMGATARSLVLR